MVDIETKEDFKIIDGTLQTVSDTSQGGNAEGNGDASVQQGSAQSKENGNGDIPDNAPDGLKSTDTDPNDLQVGDKFYGTIKTAIRDKNGKPFRTSLTSVFTVTDRVNDQLTVKATSGAEYKTSTKAVSIESLSEVLEKKRKSLEEQRDQHADDGLALAFDRDFLRGEHTNGHHQRGDGEHRIAQHLMVHVIEYQYYTERERRHNQREHGSIRYDSLEIERHKHRERNKPEHRVEKVIVEFHPEFAGHADENCPEQQPELRLRRYRVLLLRFDCVTRRRIRLHLDRLLSRRPEDRPPRTRGFRRGCLRLKTGLPCTCCS